MTGDTLASDAPIRGRETDRAHVYEQGLVAGALGAATIAAWFFVLDVIGGRPLFTPNVLGTALFHAASGVPADAAKVSFETVLVFTWIHLLVFMVMGIAASMLLELAEADQNLGFGIVLLFVVFEFGFVAVSTVFAEHVLAALSLTRVLIGNLLAAAAMGLYFWRRHPRLVIAP